MVKPLGMCQVGIKSESIKKNSNNNIYIYIIYSYIYMSNYELLYYTIWQLSTFIMTFIKGKTFCWW